MYETLKIQHEFLPEKMQQMAPVMIAQDWLASYEKLEWIELTLQRMSRRLTRGEPLAHSIIDLRANYKEFEQSFFRLFPEMIVRFQQSENLPVND